MNSRERWVIYPLLVWALGMGFRSQYFYLFERSNVECREIHLVDRDGKLRMRLSANNIEGGRLLLFDAEGEPVVVLDEKEGLVTANGKDKKQ